MSIITYPHTTQSHTPEPAEGTILSLSLRSQRACIRLGLHPYDHELSRRIKHIIIYMKSICNQYEVAGEPQSKKLLDI